MIRAVVFLARASVSHCAYSTYVRLMYIVATLVYEPPSCNPRRVAELQQSGSLVGWNWRTREVRELSALRCEKSRYPNGAARLDGTEQCLDEVSSQQVQVEVVEYLASTLKCSRALRL